MLLCLMFAACSDSLFDGEGGKHNGKTAFCCLATSNSSR